MPRYGTEKIYLDIKDQLIEKNIKMGRDKTLKFCRENNLLVPKTKRYFITTDSNHDYEKPKNIVKDIIPIRPEQVFVADITYIKLENKHAYLALITDLYSKKIMGYNLDDNMKTGLVKDALKMAIKNRIYKGKTIHHSDRGIQYCFPEYAKFAKENNMILSSTEKYDPYENAVAERINQTIKYEFGLIRTIPNLKIAKKMIDQAVHIYNNRRRHRSLDMATPEYAHLNKKHKYKEYKSKIGGNVDKVEKIP